MVKKTVFYSCSSIGLEHLPSKEKVRGSSPLRSVFLYFSLFPKNINLYYKGSYREFLIFITGK